MTTNTPRIDAKLRILVFGDAMIDRAWVVSEPSKSSQAHAGVAPQLLVAPGDCKIERLSCARPGGAALTAEWLARRNNNSVCLLASLGSDLKDLLAMRRVRLALPVSPRRHDTTKFRVYAYQGKGKAPLLRHRFDYDAEPETGFSIPLDLDRPDVVVVSDFNKGTVTKPRLTELVGLFNQARWLIDSKDPEILSLPAWEQLEQRPILFLDRSEFSALCKKILGSDNVAGIAGPWRHIEEPLLIAAEKVSRQFPKWDLVIKLDAEGAAAFWGSGMYARAADTPVANAPAIGAGDAFMAGWIAAFSAKEEPKPTACLAKAISYASAWVKETLQTHTLTRPRDVKRGALQSEPRVEQYSVQARRDALARRRDVDAILDEDKIELSSAEGFCGKFMSLDPGVRQDVGRFVSEIRDYFEADGHEPRHPLNCLVWAAPGSGKSFLVGEVAGTLGVTFREINVASMSSIRQLSDEIDKAVAADEKKMLIMIDEVMSPLGPVLSSLLAPLWSKNKSKRLAFVLVDSLPSGKAGEIASVKSLVEEISNHPKGSDLVSRLNGPRLTLKQPERFDRVYLVASLITRTHPGSVFAVSPAAMHALIDRFATWSPRAVEYVIQAVRPRGPLLRLADLKSRAEVLERFGLTLDSTVISDDVGIAITK